MEAGEGGDVEGEGGWVRWVDGVGGWVDADVYRGGTEVVVDGWRAMGTPRPIFSNISGLKQPHLVRLFKRDFCG